MFTNGKFKCHRSVLHHFLASYDHFQWIYIGLNFDNFQFQKIDLLPLWLTKFQSGYHLGYYIVCFLETYLSNSFPPKMLPLTRYIFLYILIFVNFPQIAYFTVYYVLARSSSWGVLTVGSFSESKVWSLGFLTPYRTYL